MTKFYFTQGSSRVTHRGKILLFYFKLIQEVKRIHWILKMLIRALCPAWYQVSIVR